MANKYTRTYKVDGEGANVLEASIYYSLGGINYFTYKNEPRGYYFSLTPYEDDGVWRKYVGFSGAKTCILPCERQSKKRYGKAKAMMDELIAEHLTSFCEAKGLTVLDEPYTEAERAA